MYQTHSVGQASAPCAWQGDCLVAVTCGRAVHCLVAVTCGRAGQAATPCRRATTCWGPDAPIAWVVSGSTALLHDTCCTAGGPTCRLAGRAALQAAPPGSQVCCTAGGLCCKPTRCAGSGTLLQQVTCGGPHCAVTGCAGSTILVHQVACCTAGGPACSLGKGCAGSTVPSQ